MEEHLANVQDFHAMLKIHTEWLNNAEKVLASFKYPSKLVDKVTLQIQEHKVGTINVVSRHIQEDKVVQSTWSVDRYRSIK